MRTAFIKTLFELAEKDERVWLIAGDVGFSVIEAFAERFPDRFVNAGIAEQNMTGVAAGLALEGKVPVIYSIANFPVMRCLEQIRNDVCYHGLSVKIVAVGGGLVYGAHGYSHYGVEDLAVTRVMPNMVVMAPADPLEAAHATRAMVVHGGPVYMRLGKAGEPAIHEGEIDFAIGRAVPVREGSDVTLISTGGALATALEAADGLAAEGWTAEVLSMPTVQPVDRDAVCDAAARTGRIVTVEEHGEGGLGSVIAEVMATSGAAARLACVRLRREPLTIAGSQRALAARLGVSAESVIGAARALA